MSSERRKTDLLMEECLKKLAEIIVQSRVQFQSIHNSSSRRARVSFELPFAVFPHVYSTVGFFQFNLDVDEIEFVRTKMASWKANVHQKLQIDIFWDGGSTNSQLAMENMVRFACLGIPNNWCCNRFFLKDGGFSMNPLQRYPPTHAHTHGDVMSMLNILNNHPCELYNALIVFSLLFFLCLLPTFYPSFVLSPSILMKSPYSSRWTCLRVLYRSLRKCANKSVFCCVFFTRSCACYRCIALCRDGNKVHKG